MLFYTYLIISKNNLNTHYLKLTKDNLTISRVNSRFEFYVSLKNIQNKKVLKISYHVNLSENYYRGSTDSTNFVLLGNRTIAKSYYSRTATGMDGTLHTDFRKSETSRDIKKSF
jgi:hypothetical protein